MFFLVQADIALKDCIQGKFDRPHEGNNFSEKAFVTHGENTSCSGFETEALAAQFTSLL